MKNHDLNGLSTNYSTNTTLSDLTSTSGYAYTTDWINTYIGNMSSESYIDDSEIKEKVSKKINEILDEDSTIDLMKKYLLDFIEKNIDNPEKLVLIDRDKKINKLETEIELLKEEIELLKGRVFYSFRKTYPNTDPFNPLNPLNPVH